MSDAADRRIVFRRLHESGCFVIPNPWDLGSARVLVQLDSLEDVDRVVPWIFGIARRVCHEQRRRVARDGRAGREAPIAREEITPEDVYRGAEAAAAFERAIAALPPGRRAILLLRCDHQLAYDEIAVAMRCSVAKVKVELHRARLALRASLEDAP